MKGNHLITEIIIASFGLVTELPKKDNLQGVGPNYIRDVWRRYKLFLNWGKWCAFIWE